MRDLPSTAGPDGYGETSGETGYSSASSPGKAFYQELIQKANSVPLVRLFKYYDLNFSEHNRKATCPFRSHKGGNESTPSFYYYPDTNSFCCYGCNVGGKRAHAVEFMAAMDDISRVAAAYRIIERFADEVGDAGNFDGPNFSDRLEIMLDFANSVRNFRQTGGDEKSIDFIEYLCWVYDALNVRHNLDNEALCRAVELLKEHIVHGPCNYSWRRASG